MCLLMSIRNPAALSKHTNEKDIILYFTGFLKLSLNQLNICSVQSWEQNQTNYNVEESFYHNW